MSRGQLLFSFKPNKLEHIELKQVVEYDDQELRQPKTIGYYRQPLALEYPLDLNQGFESYIHRKHSHSSTHGKVEDYLMQSTRPQEVMEHVDFCLHRKALISLMELKVNANARYAGKMAETLEAIRFKGCIYLRLANAEADLFQESYGRKRDTYAFKARQYLFADKPGEKPITDLPVDENKKLFATFTAKLGNFGLIYSGEISGLENTQPLDHLQSSELLKQYRLSSIKVFDKKNVKNDWRSNYRLKRWIIQAHLSRINYIHVALFDDEGLVHQVDGDRVQDIIKLQPREFNLEEASDFVHRLLSNIAQVMADVDCPYTFYSFTVDNFLVTYNGHERREESSLSEKFIKFMNEKM